jgi:hypothetical protein
MAWLHGRCKVIVHQHLDATLTITIGVGIRLPSASSFSPRLVVRNLIEACDWNKWVGWIYHVVFYGLRNHSLGAGLKMFQPSFESGQMTTSAQDDQRRCGSSDAPSRQRALL